MKLIEPCCSQRHVPELLSLLEDSDPLFFQGFGDLSLSDLLSPLLSGISLSDVLLMCPTLPSPIHPFLRSWYLKRWSTGDSSDGTPPIASLTIVTDCRSSRSGDIRAWRDSLIQDGLPCQSVALSHYVQNDTCLIVNDLLIYGNMNIVPRNPFSAIVTRSPHLVSEYRARIDSLSSSYRC